MIRARKSPAAAYFDDGNGDGSEIPTWIMGLPYTELREEERRSDVFSTMWITYRSGFPRMEPYGYTDDSGWGCMLRSAQMLMAQALLRHTVGRSWRVPRALEERLRVPEYRRLLQLFADQPGDDSLFSIHNMCQVGIRYDKLPGEWYGPTTAACVLRDIAELYAARPIPPPPPLRQSSAAGARYPPPPPPRDDNASAAAENGEDSEAGYTERGVQDEARAPSLASKLTTDGSAASATASSSAAFGDGKTCTVGDTAPPPLGSLTKQGGRETNVRAASDERSGGGSGGGIEVECGSGGDRSLSPASSRPLRVFVSQGDVVYIDEVEVMALRKRVVEEPTAGVDPDVGGDGREEEERPTNGSPREEGSGGGAGSEQGGQGVAHLVAGGGDDDAGRRRCPVGGGGMADDVGPGTNSPAAASPAFFDPLLNPGVEDRGTKEKEAWSSAVVLLVPLRLGLDELGAGYIPGLSEMLRVPQSLGFLGGRPNHATFWIGTQGDTLTGLDPHTTQAAPEMGDGFPSERHLHSLHCHYPVTMDIRRIDPSLALAFYLADRKAFEDLTERIRQMSPPPFSVEQTRPDYEGEMGLAFMINQRDDDGITDDEEDEYVFVKGPER